jgi:hypothetical protein
MNHQTMTPKKIFVCPPKGVPQTVVSDYLDRCRTNLPALKATLGQNEYNYARVFGHRMRGTGRAYGFPRLTDLGAVMEQSARFHDLGELKENVIALETYLSRIEIVRE